MVASRVAYLHESWVIFRVGAPQDGQILLDQALEKLSSDPNVIAATRVATGP